MLQGVAKVKKLVNDYLAHDLPTRLVTYRNYWEVDEDSLPEPLLYLTYEPVALDHWPTLITVAISMPDLTRDDYDQNLNPQYSVRYTMRTYVWVKADGSEQCTEMRDNLTTVVRSALLDHPSLRTYNNSSCDVLIEESSIREEYSDLTLIKGERVMAGAYIGYDINADEEILRSPITDSINQIQIETEILAHTMES
jgi:hypothetical protein